MGPWGYITFSLMDLIGGPHRRICFIGFYRGQPSGVWGLQGVEASVDAGNAQPRAGGGGVAITLNPKPYPLNPGSRV